MGALTTISRQLQAGWQQPGWLNFLCLPLSWLYQLLVALRRAGYRFGLLTSHRLPVPVIVVGNISTGGTGKSPLVVALVEHLRQQGYNPGVICRGYRGKAEFSPRLVTDSDDPAVVGDEPLMIRRQLGVPVAIGAQRVRSGQLLVDKYRCDVIVSDDGFQHYAIQRDIDIVVIDGERRAGNGWCLPAGPLREPLHALKRADFRVVNCRAGHGQTVEAAEWPMIQSCETLASLGVPAESKAIGELIGVTVHAVAGLGNPTRFFAALVDAGLDIIPHSFDDHHSYSAGDFEFCGPETVVVMTRKDAVKCEQLNIPGKVWILPVVAQLPDGFYHALDRQLALLRENSLNASPAH